MRSIFWHRQGFTLPLTSFGKQHFINLCFFFQHFINLCFAASIPTAKFTSLIQNHLKTSPVQLASVFSLWFHKIAMTSIDLNEWHCQHCGISHQMLTLKVVLPVWCNVAGWLNSFYILFCLILLHVSNCRWEPCCQMFAWFLLELLHTLHRANVHMDMNM